MNKLGGPAAIAALLSFNGGLVDTAPETKRLRSYSAGSGRRHG